MSNQLHTNEHFEQLLQNSADKYRMYPSDKVWDNIRTELHGKPKWPALIFIFTAIVLALNSCYNLQLSTTKISCKKQCFYCNR